MAHTAKSDWIAREVERELDDAAREQAWLTLVQIKREADPYHAPIGVDPNWDAVSLGLESIEAPTPQADYEADALQAMCVLVAASSDDLRPSNLLHWSLAATVARLDDDRANAQAAQRASLREPQGYGETKRMAVLVEQGGVIRKAIVEGTAAEIAQALPTEETLNQWRALGVTEVPAWSLVPDAPIRERMTWVPIDKAPVLKRMESVERAASV